MKRGAAALLFPLAACASEPDPHATVAARVFAAAISGDLTITQGGVAGSGTRLDLDDDLDLEGDEQGELAVDVELHGARLGLAWLPLAFEGKERLDETEIFRGTTFPAGDRVKSELELTTWKLRLDAPVHESDRAQMRLGAGAYWWNLDVELEDVDSGVREEREFSRLLPALTMAGRWRISRRWTAGVDAAFAAIDEGRRLLDLDAGAHAAMGNGIALSLGFRFLRYQLEEDTNDGTIDVFGPTLGMSWRF